MRRLGISLAVLVLLAAGGLYVVMPHFPPLAGVTQVELDGPGGPLRRITQPDTVRRLAAFAEQHYPRWGSVFASAAGGPLAVTFYRGAEPLRTVHFGGRDLLSCREDFCVGERASAADVRAFADLLGVPRRLVSVPLPDPAS